MGVAGREMGAAQHGEAFDGFGEIGARFLDGRSQLPETLRGAAADLGDFRIDRREAAEIRGIGDATKPHGKADGIEAGQRRGIEAQGISGVATGEDVEEQRQVTHVAGHRALHRQGLEGIGRGAVGNATRPGPEAEHAAEGGGRAQRAAEIGAGRKPGHAGREGDRRASRGAAAGERRVPGVACDAEDLVEGVRPGAEFGRVRLAEHDPAPGLEPLDEKIGARRNVIPEQR